MVKESKFFLITPTSESHIDLMHLMVPFLLSKTSSHLQYHELKLGKDVQCSFSHLSERNQLLSRKELISKLFKVSYSSFRFLEFLSLHFFQCNFCIFASILLLLV